MFAKIRSVGNFENRILSKQQSQPSRVGLENRHCVKIEKFYLKAAKAGPISTKVTFYSTKNSTTFFLGMLEIFRAAVL